MDQPSKLFIFTQKEVAILSALCVTLSLFAFTLGIHLGKDLATDLGHRLGSSIGNSLSPKASTVSTSEDRLPSDEEFAVGANAVESHLENLLSENLRGEVEKTGIHLARSHQVHLPENPASAHGGATTLTQSPPQGVNPGSKQRFTLQIGSYPTPEEAHQALLHFQSAHLKPFLREVTVQGKGKWFRIYLGEYPSLKAAETAGQNYKAQHAVSSFVVSKLESIQ